MTKQELYIYQWFRRTRALKPLLYGIVMVTVAFILATLAYLGIILFLFL